MPPMLASLDMKTMLNLNDLANLMRRNEGKWMMLDDDGYPATMGSRRSAWNNRPPKAFAGGGFRFRVKVNKERPQRRWVLEGMYITPNREDA